MDSEDGVIFCEDDFMSQSFGAFEDMRRKEQLVDFKINFKDRSLVGHRLVLSARIPYFRGIFCSSQKEVTLDEVDPDALESIINFAYSGKIKITPGNVESLLSVSKVLQITRVYDACWEFLERKINPNNVLESRKLAEHYSFSKFLEAADKYVRLNFEEFTSSENFLTLPFLQLKEIISRDDVKVSMEEKVFEAVIRWVKALPSEREDLLPELLSSVRLYFLTPDYLNEKVSTEELVRSSLPCRDLVDEAKSYHLLPEERSKFSVLSSQPRLYDVKSMGSRLPSQPIDSLHHLSLDGEPRRTLLYSVYRSSVSIIIVKVFDREDEDSWLDLSNLHSSEVMDAVVLLDGVIYIFTKCSVHTLDINTCKWNSLDFANKVRGSGSVSYNGRIYFVGGFEEEESAAVRSFDPLQKNLRWESRMPKPLYSPGVTLSCSKRVPLERFIFITGGHFGSNIYSTVHRYKPEAKQWTEAAPMLYKRCGHSCCDLNEKIYVCGGQTSDVATLTSAEVYDPLTDQWNLFAHIPLPEKILSVISDEDEDSLLFAYRYHTETYKLKTNEWKTPAAFLDGFGCHNLYLVKESVACDTYQRVLN